MNVSKTFMVHVELHRKDCVVDDLTLWSFYFNNSVWLRNIVLNRQYGLTPMGLLINTKADHQDFLRSQIQGCAVYLLDPKFQNCNNISKQNCLAHMGWFLGSSDERYSFVVKVRTFQTGNFFPQYHFVFGDIFLRLCSVQDKIIFLWVIFSNQLFE